MKPSDWDHENIAALEGMQEGDIEPLIALLKETNRPLHPELRLWLAVMLIGDTQAQWWLERKPHPGSPKSDPVRLFNRDFSLGLRIHQLYTEGGTITEAKSRAAKEFGIQARTIDKAWTLYRKLYHYVDGAIGNDLCQLRPPKGKRGKKQES